MLGLALVIGTSLPSTSAASPQAHTTATQTPAISTASADAVGTQSVLQQFMDVYERDQASDVSAAACVYGPLYSKGPAGATARKVVDVKGYGTANRSAVHLYAYRTSGNVENQRWFLCDTNRTWNGWPVVTLENSNAIDKCLDKSEDQADRNGTPVYIYQCSGAANQQWAIVNRSDGYFELRNMASDDGVGRYLDISRSQWADQTPIWVWSRTGAWNQAWE